MQKSILRLSTLFFFFISLSINAQIDGDNLFENDQVVKIELTFHQTGYWDSLEANYTNSEYMKADLTITDTTGTTSFTDVGVRFKGNSSYSHPNNKKPFKIDFNKYVSGQDYDGIKKLNLSNCFNDPSMLREKVFFDFCKEVGVPAPRANFANLYINGTLWGFYTLVEQIDDQFLDWAILDDDGNLFKAGDNFGTGSDAADLVYYGSTASNYTTRYELKTNETANDWSDLIYLIDYINNSTDADFLSEFDTRFEKEELLTSIAVDNLFGNLDSYIGSARNYYLYHNLTTNKWEWIKWDANESFGTYSTGQNPLTMSVNYHETDRPLVERIFDDVELNAEYMNIVCYLLENYFNNAHLDSRIDELYNLIKEDVYADNNKMYTNAEFDQSISTDLTSGGGPGGGPGGPGGGGPGGTSVYGLKSFITARSANVASEINCSTYLDVNEMDEVDFTIYPNPATNDVYVQLSSVNVPTDLKIYSTAGTLVKSIDIGQNNSDVHVDISGLNAGMYLLYLTTDKGVLKRKLLIE